MLTSVRTRTWIWPKPSTGKRFLGYMRVGQRVALRSTELVPGQGCAGGFYAVAPRGYVCRDRTVTLARSTPFLRANAHTMPASGPFPYHWALSNGAPMYTRVPTADEQRRVERRFGAAGSFAPLSFFQRGHEQLASREPIEPSGPAPAFVAGGVGAFGVPRPLVKRTIPLGSMLAYTRAFDVDGRTFLLSADLTLVPADRVRRFRPSSFHGVRLGAGVTLPIGWFVTAPGKGWRLQGDRLLPSTERWPRRSWVRLTGAAREQDGVRYLGVRGRDRRVRYVAASSIRVVRRRERRPFGVREGDKWLLVSITQGTLVAYDDLRPVYATLISPGLGGVPRRGGDLVHDSTTPLGSYRITFKDRAATMSPEKGNERSFWIADVPFTQYFDPPFAVHGAFWHERFGEPMSGGCINASPLDAAWLFDWSEPQVPAGWQGATGAGARENGRASWVVVTR